MRITQIRAGFGMQSENQNTLSATQLEQLETASALRKESQPWTEELGNINLVVALAPQRVAAITIEFT